MGELNRKVRCDMRNMLSTLTILLVTCCTVNACPPAGFSTGFGYGTGYCTRPSTLVLPFQPTYQVPFQVQEQPLVYSAPAPSFYSAPVAPFADAGYATNYFSNVGYGAAYNNLLFNQRFYNTSNFNYGGVRFRGQFGNGLPYSNAVNLNVFGRGGVSGQTITQTRTITRTRTVTRP